jgi:two-component sensor histidine kinase
LALALAVLMSCGFAPSSAGPVKGVLDLRTRDWRSGPVVLAGEWAFEGGFRRVPDTWSGNDAGGPDGRGAGTYRLTVLLADAPPLALRYGSVSTAFLVRANGSELVRVGQPDRDPARAASAYAPGTVPLPSGTRLDLEFFVSNHDYRVGGFWTAPSLGPKDAIEDGQWADEAAALALAVALAVIGVSSLVLFLYRRADQTFLSLGLFALLVALRALVTGEYPMVRILPHLPFDVLIRLEYLSAFLPLPSAAAFFSRFYPGVLNRWGFRALTWPSLAFAALTLVLPLDLLTRSILWFYPFSVPALVFGAVVLIRRIIQEKHNGLLLVGVTILIGTGLTDTLTAALAATTGTLVPWGMGIFVALQATTLARRFISAFEDTERHLAEKDFLIKEVHHRVKNSLQVVASLVTLQANRLGEPAQKEVFLALRRRITAISLVHEKLYGRGWGGQPDVGEYLKELLILQFPADILSSGGVTWDVQAEPMAAEVDFCIDAGLILTELAANAQRHVLLPRRGTKLSLNIRLHEGRLAIEADDDGPGFPEDFRPEASQGLGYRLIVALLDRNDGTLSFPHPGRGSVRVDLRLPSASD